MKILKYSRQRESIKSCLSGRTDHPTADMIYTDIKEEFPNISLGTVYRNLNLLSELGEVQKLACGDGKDIAEQYWTYLLHPMKICSTRHRKYSAAPLTVIWYTFTVAVHFVKKRQNKNGFTENTENISQKLIDFL